MDRSRRFPRHETIQNWLNDGVNVGIAARFRGAGFAAFILRHRYYAEIAQVIVAGVSVEMVDAAHVCLLKSCDGQNRHYDHNVQGK
jgi:hypothetical protein